MAGGRGKFCVPQRGEIQLLEEQQTAQAKLRAAVYNGISEQDVKQVVAALVQKAKKGDRTALKFLFEHVLGSGLKTAVQNNYIVERPAPAAANGRDLQGMRRRAQSGLPIFDEQDGNGD